MSANLDQDRVRWPGSGSAVPGRTPFGFYDDDKKFTSDCSSSAVWAAIRLGYPIEDIELIDLNFYAAFEEAVNEYSSQVNQFNIRNNMLNLLGTPANKDASGKAVTGSPLPYVINLSRAYGSEVGVGGNVDWKKGHVDVIAGQQNYDLQCLYDQASGSGNRLEVKRVFHYQSPAMARIYDPFSMTGMSYSNVLNEMGFAGYSPAVQFLMTPIFEDLLRGQAIEFNDMVRKSAYSFELVNNKLRLFPIPNSNYKVYFEYSLDSDKQADIFTPGDNYDKVSDYSNVPYDNLRYNTINGPGRQWIRKYFLALCKEVLGAIRQKYSTIPIPGGEVTLDGAELRSEASAEKEALMSQLREMLEATLGANLIEQQANKAEKNQEILRKVPMFIYIG
jgi:hypothetical protein